MPEAAPASSAAPTASPAGGAQAPTGASPAPGASAPAAQLTNGAQGSPGPAAKPARAPMLIKHKAKIAGPDGVEAEHELDVDIAEHFYGHKHKYSADGQEREATIEEILSRAPLADAAHRRMQESSKIRVEHEKFQNQVKALDAKMRTPQGAREVLMHTLGPEKTRDLVETWMADLLADEKMTPAQRQARDKETARERDYREREQVLSQREAKAKLQREASIAHEATTIRERNAKEWPGHLQAAGVPVTPRTLDMVRAMKLSALDAGYTLTDQQAAAEVRVELDRLMGEVGKKLPATREAEIAQLEEQPGRTAIPRVATAPKPVQPQAGETFEDFRERMRAEADRETQARLLRRHG